MSEEKKESREKRFDWNLSRRDFLRYASIAAGGAALSACGAPAEPGAGATEAPTAAAEEIATATVAPTAAPAQIQKGGHLTFVIHEDPANLIPFGATNTGNHWPKENIYESLVTWDRDLIVQPSLADSWETPDNMTYVWHLREGVEFHNGDEVTAEDVVYSMEMQKDPPAPGSSKQYYPMIESVEAVDKYTVKFNMSQPDPTVLGYLAWERYSSIVPKNAYDRWNLLQEGIGTGPFKLVEYVPNDRIEFEKFDGYWNPDLPHLGTMTQKVLLDPSTRVAALRSGEVGASFLEADSALRLMDDPNVNVVKGLFSAPRVLQFTLKNEGKPWEDKRVRQAINHAVNRQDVIDKVEAGQAVWSGVIPPGYGDWFIPQEELKEDFYKFDLEKAKNLMADAGYSDGFKVTCHTIANHAAERTSEVMKEHLRAINIDVDIIAEEIGTFAQRVGDGTFDWCVTGRGMRHDPKGYLQDFALVDHGIYANWWAGGEGYRNEEYIELFNDYLKTVDDVKRHEQVRRMQEIVLTDLPHIHFYQSYWFHGHRNDVHGIWPAYTNFYPCLRRTAWVET
jgi:peptide/nickel transport system substrate-binding protein